MEARGDEASSYDEFENSRLILLIPSHTKIQPAHKKMDFPASGRPWPAAPRPTELPAVRFSGYVPADHCAFQLHTTPVTSAGWSAVTSSKISTQVGRSSPRLCYVAFRPTDCPRPASYGICHLAARKMRRDRPPALPTATPGSTSSCSTLRWSTTRLPPCRRSGRGRRGRRPSATSPPPAPPRPTPTESSVRLNLTAPAPAAPAAFLVCRDADRCPCEPCTMAS